MDNTRNYLKKHHERIIRLQEVIRQRPLVLFRDFTKNLVDAQEILKRTVRLRIVNNRIKLNGYEKIIDVVDPANTIKRGFSITRTADGRLLRSIRSAQPKEKMKTELIDGIITSEIGDVEKT